MEFLHSAVFGLALKGNPHKKPTQHVGSQTSLFSSFSDAHLRVKQIIQPRACQRDPCKGTSVCASSSAHIAHTQLELLPTSHFAQFKALCADPTSQPAHQQLANSWSGGARQLAEARLRPRTPTPHTNPQHVSLLQATFSCPPFVRQAGRIQQIEPLGGPHRAGPARGGGNGSGEENGRPDFGALTLFLRT